MLPRILTPTPYSTQLGDIDCARSLVNTGVDLNIADHRQRTLLHHLVTNRRYGNKELYMLQFFLFMGFVQ